MGCFDYNDKMLCYKVYGGRSVERTRGRMQQGF